MARPDRPGLTPGQARFVDEYLADRNASAAYLRAFPATGPGSARSSAARLLAKANIRAAVRAGERRLSRRNGDLQDRAVREIERLAFSDIADVMVFDKGRVRLRPFADMTPDARRAIKAVRVRPPVVTHVGKGKGRKAVVTEPVEVVLHDKLAALDKLFRLLGLYKDQPPLEALLAALPPDLAAVVRSALAGAVLGGRPPATSGDERPTG